MTEMDTWGPYLDLYYGLVASAITTPRGPLRTLLIEAARDIERHGAANDPEPTKLTRDQLDAQLAKDGVIR